MAAGLEADPPRGEVGGLGLEADHPEGNQTANGQFKLFSLKARSSQTSQHCLSRVLLDCSH